MNLLMKPIKPLALIVGAPNLVKKQQTPSLIRHYTMGLDDNLRRNVAFASIQVDMNNKYLKKPFDEDVEQIAEWCEVNGVDVIGCTNPKFWQFATGDKQFTGNIGKAMMGKDKLEGIKIVPILNYFILLARPDATVDLEKGVATFNKVANGDYDFNEGSGADKVKKYLFDTALGAKKGLAMLEGSEVITMDIETSGLTMGVDKTITVALTNNTDFGVAFAVCEEYSSEHVEIKKLLAKFLKEFKGEHVWHNAMFDIPFIMRDIMRIPFTNQRLINKTINNMDLVDTLHISYLCRNSTSRMGNGLKELIYSKYGEYDADVDQSRLLDYSFEDVGSYNVLDVTATMEVYNEYYPKMIEEEQEDIFLNYYKPSLKTLLKLKYRGVDVNVEATKRAAYELEDLLIKDKEKLARNEYVIDTEYNLNVNAMFKYNSTHKKQKTISDFDLKFNPGSSAQKSMLLYDVMGLPVVETTPKGNPATGKAVINQLISTLSKQEDIDVLETLLHVSEAAKVSTAFLKAFTELSVKAEDETFRIHGDYKLSGTLSGRLSAANPNLQNLPSGSTYGKLIKNLFEAPEGKVFWGSDYNALETHVGAILTHDVALRKILLDGYDSHSLYTAVYFEDELKERGLPYGSNITVEESFIIKEEAADLRQDSKSVTFALQYGGTYRTVAKSLGCSNEKAEQIVESYHKLHGGVTAYYKKMTDSARETGYYLLETGLKLRAPGLQSTDEHICSSTERSAENALIQGFGMLTVKAMNRLQKAIEDEGMEDDVTVIMNIHDAIYGYCTETPEVIKWLNEKLVEVMIEDFYEGQDIKLRAEMDIGFTWKQQVTLSNGASIEDIEKVLKECKEELSV